MLSPVELDALAGGALASAANVLGLQFSASGELWVHAVVPAASGVEIWDADKNTLVKVLRKAHPSGIFCAKLRRKKLFAYRLKIDWADGSVGSYADAYAFEPQISDDDLYFLGEGTHLRPYTVLGAHPLEREDGAQRVVGVRFALIAPAASRVSVIGPFNSWDGRRHVMRRRGSGGVWELFVPHIGAGELYKFEITGHDGRLLPLKADPYAFASQLRPESASVVAHLSDISQVPASRQQANRRDAPVSIYEVHLASWARRADGSFLSWDELASRLPDYALDLGFTHIELLPITEHPFDGSWGYQCLGMYAVTARHGPIEGMRRFVAACHARGLGVLLDWVPAHFAKDGHGLERFDGSALFEYADPREGEHKDWGTLIYNYARPEVKNFLVGSALFWSERYGVDGLRVDAVASMLYRDYSRQAGEWVPNQHGGRENLEAIALFQRINEVLGEHAPSAITLAEESTSFAGVTALTSAGGLGFHYKWNMGWMNDTLRYMREDPINRRWHHDKMTFGMVYAFSENFVLPLSHDEVVHGKGSLLQRMPGDDWQRFANLRAYYGFMWGHPGKKLLFMGQEFAQPHEWQDHVALPWTLLENPAHAGVQALVRDLNALYKSQPALHQRDCESAGFEWIDSADADNSVFSWIRRDAAGNAMLVVCNMTPVPRAGIRLGVPPGPAHWREVLNTDARIYGGSGMGNQSAALAVEAVPAHGRDQSIQYTLPPLATLFLAPC